MYVDFEKLPSSLFSENAKLIEKATYSGIILPSADWHTLNHHGLTAKITYRIRVQCEKNYYNSTCMKFCRPRDDKFGHFICDAAGNKECIAGWKGANCEIGELRDEFCVAGVADDVLLKNAF